MTMILTSFCVTATSHSSPTLLLNPFCIILQEQCKLLPTVLFTSKNQYQPPSTVTCKHPNFFSHLPCQASCCHIILSHYLRQHQAPWPQFTWHISTTPKWFFSRRHSSLPYVLNIFKGIHAQKMIKDSLPTCPAASGGQSCTAGTVRSTLSGPRWSHSSTEGGGPACKCWHLFPRPLLHQSTD